jgi:hypothetical protein
MIAGLILKNFMSSKMDVSFGEKSDVLIFLVME